MAQQRGINRFRIFAVCQTIQYGSLFSKKMLYNIPFYIVLKPSYDVRRQQKSKINILSLCYFCMKTIYWYLYILGLIQKQIEYQNAQYIFVCNIFHKICHCNLIINLLRFILIRPMSWCLIKYKKNVHGIVVLISKLNYVLPKFIIPIAPWQFCNCCSRNNFLQVMTHFATYANLHN